jgi:hypothetical protein
MSGGVKLKSFGNIAWLSHLQLDRTDLEVVQLHRCVRLSRLGDDAVYLSVSGCICDLAYTASSAVVLLAAGTFAHNLT